MAYRCILIESDARISLRNSQLVIHTGEEHSVPVEDISALLLESRKSTVTTAALARLGAEGCAVYVCDEKHLPCAVLTPYQQHSRGLEVLRNQLDAGEPLKKRLWQAVVKEKIRNQARCLELAGLETKAAELMALAERIRSGDSDNGEATAAQAYFPALFGKGFTRGEENGQNAALNYGYAILRGCVARTLAVYGFHPAFGLHHRSTLNPFNLADDLMEPFRPMADLLVYRSMNPEDTLSPAHKRLLFNLLNLDVLSGEQHHSLAYAVERMVRSLRSALEDKSPTLVLPRLLELHPHEYE